VVNTLRIKPVNRKRNTLTFLVKPVSLLYRQKGMVHDCEDGGVKTSATSQDSASASSKLISTIQEHIAKWYPSLRESSAVANEVTQ
jgi:hypothetical protein